MRLTPQRILVLVYIIGRRYAGWRAGLLAMLLLATSPAAVMMGRKIWAQNLLPVVMLAALLAGFAGMVDGDKRARWVFLPLVTLAGMVYFGAFVIIPAMGYLLYIGWQQGQVDRRVWLSLAGVGLIVAPYVAGLVYTGWHTPARWDEFRADRAAANQERSSTLPVSILAERLITSTDMFAVLGEQGYYDYAEQHPNDAAYRLFDTLAILALAAGSWLVLRVLLPELRDARTPIDMTLLLLVLAPMLAFVVPWTLPYIHYLFPMLPAVYLMIGFAAHDLIHAITRKRLRYGVQAIGGIWLAALIMAQASLLPALLHEVDTATSETGFGVPLGDYMQVRDYILNRQIGHVHLALSRTELATDELIWKALLFPVPQVTTPVDGQPQPPFSRVDYACENAGDDYILRTTGMCLRVTTVSGSAQE